MTISECVAQADGGGWSNLWGTIAADRWGSFIRKKFGIKYKKPTCDGLCSVPVGFVARVFDKLVDAEGVCREGSHLRPKRSEKVASVKRHPEKCCAAMPADID